MAIIQIGSYLTTFAQKARKLNQNSFFAYQESYSLMTVQQLKLGIQMEESEAAFYPKAFKEAFLNERKTAADQLFKEIGVDIERFLLQQPPTIQESKPLISSGLMMPSLPSLSSLGGQVKSGPNPPQVLEMKYKQMKVSSIKNNLPTDEEYESYQENHQRRIQMIEQRFISSVTDESEQHNEVEAFYEPELRTKQKTPIESLFQKRFPQEKLFEIPQDQRVCASNADDLMIEDLDDDFQAIPKTSSSLVLVKKTKEDRVQEKELIEKIVSGMIGVPREEEKRPPKPKIMGFFDDQDAPQQCAVAMVEEDVNFDDVDESINDLLPQGKLKDRLVEIQKPTSILAYNGPDSSTYEHDGKFSTYMSWQTPNTADSYQDQDLPQQASLSVKPFRDPFSLPDDFAEESEEKAFFRYNEHGIYSDHSEDEESIAL